jgi:gas vesicle protein
MADRTAPNTLVVSLLAGLAGATVALLFAPRSGRETREMLHEKADKLKHRTQEGLDTARNKVERGVESAKDMKDHLTTTIANSGRRARERMEEPKDTDKQDNSATQSPVLTNWEEEV